MEGILLDRPIRYYYASFRYFKEREHHIERLCREDVLLLVFEGVLRFSEDGEEYELHAGEYHIQRHGSYQAGPKASDAPKYLYIHFLADWGAEEALPRKGQFDPESLREAMRRMDQLAHSDASYIAKCGAFYEILAKLQKKKKSPTIAEEIASFLSQNAKEGITLEALCEKFHFSKNHIITLFKKAYGQTPIAYANQKRLEAAEYQMEVTSLSLEEIALMSGFSDYSHFYKLFMKKHRCSPERWRAEIRKK